jgi:hypothetical protein
MIIWSGFGFLIFILGFGSAIGTELISENLTGDERYYQQHPAMISVAMLSAAILTYLLHLLLSRQKGQVVIDKATGQEIVLGRSHSLFFIPVKWWPVIFLLIAVIVPFTVKPE